MTTDTTPPGGPAAEVSRHDYLPFGQEWQPANLGRDRLSFTGKERDTETALDYLGARHLRTAWGRFTTVDPVQTTAENLVDPQRWTRYAYARNNPLRWVDPDGRAISVNEELLNDVRGLVPEELRKHIVLGKNGTIDVSALKAAGSDNAVLQGLLRLASSKTRYDIVSTDTLSFREGYGVSQTWKMEDAPIKDLFLPGDATQNMFSRAGTPTSQDGRNMVYLSSGLPTMLDRATFTRQQLMLVLQIQVEEQRVPEKFLLQHLVSLPWTEDRRDKDGRFG